MKRKETKELIEVRLGIDGVKCDKCLHVRVNEPYAFHYHYRAGSILDCDIVCWLCCRDAESTFLIQQKWPLAFERLNLAYGYILDWTSGVKSLVGKPDEI